MALPERVGTGTESGWTYRRSGFDRDSVGSALSALLGQVRYHPPASSGRPIRAPGHYAGLVRIGRETLAITTDTVGTKVLLAEQLGRWEEVGEDIVAINVNDLASVGARPAALVDVISCARPDSEVFRAIGRGIQRGIRQSRCALVGGETAMVPELVPHIDLGGTAVGFFPPRRQPVTGSRIQVGDQLVGIPSSGLHSNGFTLVRRMLAANSVALDLPRPGGTEPLGMELLTPTRIYVRAVESVAAVSGVHGFAHISGGGVRNLSRLQPKRCFVLDAWPAAPPLFRWLCEMGGVPVEERYQTFNMGIGFVLVVARAQTERVLRTLGRAGAPDANVVGRVVAGTGVRIPDLDLSYSGYR